VQVLQTAQELRRLGVIVELFDSWSTLASGSVDLVHVFGAGMGTYHTARAIHQQGVPIVLSPIYITRRSPAFVKTVRWGNRLLQKAVRGTWTDYEMIAELCAWSACVAPNTKEEADLFNAAFDVPVEKITVVPNGVEQRFASADPALFEKTHGIKDFVLNIGHIGPERKNVMRLVEALEGIDRNAVIIGRIEKTAEGKRILDRARSNSRLKIIDHVDHDSPLLASAYAACDVFAMPSLFETPSIAALEAGLAGAKVVITPHGGPKEYFGDRADYVDPYSVESIRTGIIKALARPKSPSLSAHIASRYLWNHVAEQTLAVYERVVRS
jgi:glycosyltransferase involved in cell wall biosynthesis